MKKINWWKDIVMMVFMLAMTISGVFLMENEWIEIGSSLIWVAGMIAIVTIYVASKFVGPVREMFQYIKEKYNKMLDQM